MRNGLTTFLDTDVLAPTLMSDSSRGSRTQIRIKHEITRRGSDFEDSINQHFRFGRVKHIFVRKQFN